VSHLDILNERMSSDLLDMLEKKQIYERPPGICFKDTVSLI